MPNLMTTAGKAWLRADTSRWASADVRLRLVASSETGIDATLTSMTGVGVSATDAALTGRNVTHDVSTNRLLLAASDTTTPDVASGDFDRLVLFAFDTNDAGSLPLAVVEYSPFTADGRPKLCDWDNEGAIWIALDPAPPDAGDYPPATYSRSGGLTSSLDAAQSSLVPRNSSGTPDAGGYMTVLGLGMSSAKTHFDRLKQLWRDDPTWSALRHPRLVYQRGANSGLVADNWANPSDSCWTDAVARVGSNYIDTTAAQVVHIHIMLTQSWPSLSGWRDGSIVTPIGYMTSSQVTQIVTNAKSFFPNLVSLDLHSHAWTGNSTTDQAPIASVHSDDALLATMPGTIAGVLVDYLQVYTQGATYNAQHTTTLFPSGLRFLTPDDYATDNIHPSVDGADKMATWTLSRWLEDPVKAWMWA